MLTRHDKSATASPSGDPHAQQSVRVMLDMRGHATDRRFDRFAERFCNARMNMPEMGWTPRKSTSWRIAAIAFYPPGLFTRKPVLSSALS